MKKVLTGKSSSRFALFLTVCNVLGAVINFAANDTWTGIVFCAAALSTLILYINQLQEND